MSCAIANDFVLCHMLITVQSFSTYSTFESFESILCEFYIYDKEFENVIDFVGDSTVNQKFSIYSFLCFGPLKLKIRYAIKKLPFSTTYVENQNFPAIM